MANNYTPNYNQYLTQTAGYALPSSVRSYSVFDPSSNSWRRMTNDGRSPMQQGTQADVQAALRLADSSQGKVWDNPAPAQPMVQTQTPGIMLRPRTPAQTPAQTPLGGPRMASRAPSPAPIYTGGGYAEVRKEFPDSEADVAFLHESPRPAPNPNNRNVTITVIPRGKANSNNANESVKPAPNQPSTLDNITLYNPLNIGNLLFRKGVREATPYVTNAINTYNQAMQESGNALRNWGSGFMDWLQR